MANGYGIIAEVAAGTRMNVRFLNSEHDMPLVQLIYVSTAAHPLSEDELREIHDSATRRNAVQEVTGLLLYSNGSFMQVLEGEREAVHDVMSRIQHDCRHHSIDILTESRVDSREFGRWSMGFRGITPQDVAAFPTYARFFAEGFNAEQIGATEGLALEILSLFAQTH
jgi:hypothetical protein